MTSPASLWVFGRKGGPVTLLKKAMRIPLLLTVSLRTQAMHSHISEKCLVTVVIALLRSTAIEVDTPRRIHILAEEQVPVSLTVLYEIRDESQGVESPPGYSTLRYPSSWYPIELCLCCQLSDSHVLQSRPLTLL